MVTAYFEKKTEQKVNKTAKLGALVNILKFLSGTLNFSYTGFSVLFVVNYRFLFSSFQKLLSVPSVNSVVSLRFLFSSPKKFSSVVSSLIFIFLIFRSVLSLELPKSPSFISSAPVHYDTGVVTSGRVLADDPPLTITTDYGFKNMVSTIHALGKIPASTPNPVYYTGPIDTHSK